MRKTLLAAAVLVSVLSAQSQALYVDASTTNTAIADGSENPWYASSSVNDGLWGIRTGFGNNDDYLLGTPGNEIFEATGTNFNEDCAAIVTTISGLTAGQQYDVSVIYWSSTSSTQSWNVRAGFSLEDMTLFDRGIITGATAGIQGKRDGTSDRYEYAGLIGRIAADEDGQIKVYINDRPASSSYSRSWYDGVELTAVPEPATMLLLAVGGLLLGRKR